MGKLVYVKIYCCLIAVIFIIVVYGYIELIYSKIDVIFALELI